MTESPSFVAAQVTPVQSVFRAPRSEPCACGQPPCRPEIALRFLFHPFLGIQLTYSTSLQRSCFLLLRRSQARDTSFPKLGAVLGSLGPGPGRQAWMCLMVSHSAALPRQIRAGEQRWPAAQSQGGQRAGSGSLGIP